MAKKTMEDIVAQIESDIPILSFFIYPARASFQRNAGLFAIAREGCLSGLQRGS